MVSSDSVKGLALGAGVAMGRPGLVWADAPLVEVAVDPSFAGTLLGRSPGPVSAGVADSPGAGDSRAVPDVPVVGA